jgi:predicted nucleic-acid-binding protein
MGTHQSPKRRQMEKKFICTQDSVIFDINNNCYRNVYVGDEIIVEFIEPASNKKCTSDSQEQFEELTETTMDDTAIVILKKYTPKALLIKTRN